MPAERAPIRVGLAGFGSMGRRHAAALEACPDTALASVADPEGGQHPDLAAMIAAGGIDAVILATPSALHAAQALACVEAGLPVLVEKPFVTDLADGARIAAAAEAAGVPVLVGHHRRHNPMIAKARETIAGGALGTIRAVHADCWLPKPEPYFAPPWRRAKGAGPLLTNLIHDLDLLRHLCGEVVEVQAALTHDRAGSACESGAGAILRFASGALGTVTLSDAVEGPWSWELTAAENDAYPACAASCYRIGGSEAALELPSLTLWRSEGGWMTPMAATRLTHGRADPLIRQAAHLAAVARGEAAPLVSARDALASLALVEAVREAGETGRMVRPSAKEAA